MRIICFCDLVIGGNEDKLTGMQILAKMSRMRHVVGLAKIPATVPFCLIKAVFDVMIFGLNMASTILSEVKEPLTPNAVTPDRVKLYNLNISIFCESGINLGVEATLTNEPVQY